MKFDKMSVHASDFCTAKMYLFKCVYINCNDEMCKNVTCTLKDVFRYTYKQHCVVLYGLMYVLHWRKCV